MPTQPSVRLAHIGRPDRLDQIDVLRGLAALSVVIFHYAGHASRYMDFPFRFEWGRHGVQMFFVISGFFILATVEQCATAREFLVLRFSRLYPVYWAVLLMLLVFDLATSDQRIWWANYVANASMLQSLIGMPDKDIVFWSLAVEMVFYLVMAALMAMGAIGRPFAIAVAWLLLSNAWPFVQGMAVAQMSWIKTFGMVLAYGPFFVGGMMFHLLRKSGWERPAAPLGILALCVATAFQAGSRTDGTVAMLTLLWMGLALRGHLRAFVHPATLWLGAISYSLYLVHRNLGYVALFKLQAMGLDTRLAMPVVLVGALALASCFTYAIERPSLRFLRARLRARGLP